MLVNNAQNKYSINLLQAELQPEKVLLTLSRVVMLWLLALFLMIAWVLSSHYSKQQLTAKFTVIQHENKKQTQQLKALTTQLSKGKVDPLLTEQLETIKLLLTNKTALHTSLTNPNQTYVAGFAAAMDELSQMHHRDIRLQTIHISNEQMIFTGLALTPEAVPAWLAGFEKSLLLSGKLFEHFKLAENEQKITEFTVSSKSTPEVLP